MHITALAVALALQSGLPDPLADHATCMAFADRVETASDPGLEHDLAAIAFMEGMAAHRLFHDDVQTASDLLFARSQDALDMSDAVLRAFVERACRQV